MIPSAPRSKGSNGSKSTERSRSRFLSTGVATGAGAGSATVAADILTSPSVLPAADVSQLILAFTALGVLVVAPITLVIGVLSRWLLPGWIPMAAVAGVLAGVAARFALSQTLARELPLTSAAIPWLVALVVYRLWAVGKFRRFWCRGVGLAIVLASAVPVLRVLDVRLAGSLRSILWVALLGVVLYMVQAAAARRPLPVLAPLAVLLVALQVAGGSAILKEGLIETDATPNDLAAGASRPNIVLIVLDTTRRDHFGCYGSPRGLTPRIDAFAAEAVVYENMIAPSPWTVPSHASLFTGHYPTTHGSSYEHGRDLDARFVTLAEMLSERGYRTVAAVANPLVHMSNLLQGFADELPVWRHIRRTRVCRWLARAGVPKKWADHGAVEAVSRIDSWLGETVDDRRPFFLFVNLMEAHGPWEPPYSWRRRHLPEGTSYVGATRLADRFQPRLWTAGQKHTIQEEETIRGLYTAMIAYQDQQVGELLDVLRSRLELDDTLVIITADHGENLGEGERWGHNLEINDILTRVPFIVRFPRLFPPGERVEGLFQLVDVVPTILDVLGDKHIDTGLPGRALIPGRSEPYDYALSELHPFYDLHGEVTRFREFRVGRSKFGDHLYVIRNDRHSFLWSARGVHELYDLVSDPREERNLIDESPEVAHRLEQQLASWRADLAPYTEAETKLPSPLDEDRLEELRALGYIGR